MTEPTSLTKGEAVWLAVMLTIVVYTFILLAWCRLIKYVVDKSDEEELEAQTLTKEEPSIYGKD